MISVKIEKELKGESKVIGNFTFRQIIGLAIAVIGIIIIYFLLHPDMNTIMIFGLFFGVIAYTVGWAKKDNIHLEYFLLKRFKTQVLKNTMRKYRTKNKYITMLNKAYQRDKSEDMKDKKKQKVIKKQSKEAAQKAKASKMKAYI